MTYQCKEALTDLTVETKEMVPVAATTVEADVAIMAMEEVVAIVATEAVVAMGEAAVTAVSSVVIVGIWPGSVPRAAVTATIVTVEAVATVEVEVVMAVERKGTLLVNALTPTVDLSVLHEFGFYYFCYLGFL
ncbi:hypothetical protein ACS0TY_001961 [Phlomoides rotata]